MLSFIKGKQKQEPKAKTPKKGGLLAVWGAPGSGKSTVAVKLAKHLAENKHNVLLVLCDQTAPMLPCICLSSQLDGEHSLGELLASDKVTESLVRCNCMTLKALPHLGVLGMRKGENEYSYTYTEKQVEELLAAAREIAPYVIVDCSSYLASDVLSTTALLEADDVLRLVNANLKSVSYLSSQLPVLRRAQWDEDKQYKALNNLCSYEAGGQVEAVLGSMAFTIPHSHEVETQYLAGSLLDDLCLKDSRPFRKEMAKICLEVFGV